MWPLLLAGPAPFCRSAPASPSAWLDVSLSRLASGVVCAVCNAVEPRIMPRTIAATADALLGGTTAARSLAHWLKPGSRISRSLSTPEPSGTYMYCPMSSSTASSRSRSLFRRHGHRSEVCRLCCGPSAATMASSWHDCWMAANVVAQHSTWPPHPAVETICAWSMTADAAGDTCLGTTPVATPIRTRRPFSGPSRSSGPLIASTVSSQVMLTSVRPDAGQCHCERSLVGKLPSRPNMLSCDVPCTWLPGGANVAEKWP
mmetsp:Transcript_4742/g.14355  ORF Transcript_4742/g.14355 Transcript_4742/m.14355 type:complete len:259 (+) Transcript_4742:1853-2629(+)